MIRGRKSHHGHGIVRGNSQGRGENRSGPTRRVCRRKRSAIRSAAATGHPIHSRTRDVVAYCSGDLRAVTYEQRGRRGLCDCYGNVGCSPVRAGHVSGATRSSKKGGKTNYKQQKSKAAAAPAGFFCFSSRTFKNSFHNSSKPNRAPGAQTVFHPFMPFPEFSASGLKQHRLTPARHTPTQ